MAHRALEVKVAKVNLSTSTKDNRSLKLTDIKVGDKVNVDFMKTQERKLLAKGITVLS